MSRTAEAIRSAPVRRPGFQAWSNTTMPSFSAVPPHSDGLTSRDFPVHWPVLTRWADNDMFGHLNNAVYYQLFDTAINGWIQTTVPLDPLTPPPHRILPNSASLPFSHLHFPERLLVGVALTPLGTRSETSRLVAFCAAHAAPPS